MLNRIIELSLNNRLIVLLLAGGLGVWGWWAVGATPIDAIPDLSDNQVIVFTEWAGHSAREVEDQVSYPLTVNLQGLPGVRVVRSQSAFGFSMIYVIFEDDVEQYFARTRVLERLNLVSGMLPEGTTATLGPDATGVGHVFWYTIESDRHSLRDLRSIQDWFVRYQLNAVPGVAEVASIGGHVQQYQIDIDPNRLRAYNLSLGDVVEAVRRSNQNVGGNVLESNGTWSIVRGVGLVESVDDIAQTVVGASGGVPVYVNQVGEVRIGDAFRVSSLVKGTDEAVGGVIVARTGANAQQVIDGVKARIQQISPGLPEGVTIVPFYDRSTLIEQAVDTLETTLLEEIALVTLAHVVFLMHLRSILIVTLPLPLAVLMSFLAMYYVGISSNIMSLAGIAIAIGVLVDAGIVVTENAFRQIERSGISVRDRRAVWATVLESTRLVGRPVFFSMAIIVLAFIPVFALTGQAGKLFQPLAFTKTFAVIAATVLAVTVVPVLCTLLLGGRMRDESANPVMRVLRGIYRPSLEAAMSHRWITVTAAVLVFAGALLVATRIGGEFMPPLNEGDMLFMPIADPSISLEQNTEIARRQNAAFMQVPEVEYAVAKVGRADTSTDPSPLNMTETVVHLRPRDQWRPGMTLERLRAELSAAAQLPGVTNIWTMPIINRIEMLSTGIRSEVGVKIYGSDLAVLDDTARRVADVLRTVPGAANVYPEPLVGAQYLNVRVDRDAAARYGLSVAAVQDVIETAIGERVVTRTFEGRQRFPVRVRYAAEYRDEVETLGNVLVAAPSGEQVPLAQVAHFEHTRGAAMITSENGLLLATVLLNIQGRDVTGFVEDARATVAAQVHAAARILPRMERPVREPGTGPPAPAVDRADRADCHLRAAVFHLPLGTRSVPRAAHRAVRADGRRVLALDARLQLLRRRLGGIHRAVRNRGADGRSDGDLPGGSGSAQNGGARDHADENRTARSRHGRGAASASAQGHDRVDSRGGSAADHVDRSCGRRGDEAAGDAGARRDGVVAAVRAHRDARVVLLDSRTSPSSRVGCAGRGGPGDRGGSADPFAARDPPRVRRY